MRKVILISIFILILIFLYSLGYHFTYGQIIFGKQQPGTVLETHLGIIKKVFKKNDRYYLVIDYIQDCISDPDKAFKLIIQDKKCPPGVTFEDLKKAYEGGAGNIGSVCPKQPFGYGTGYCYFRNINPLLRTFEIDPEVSIVYYRHPYDFDTPREILGNIISLSSWVDLFNKGLYYTIETEPGKTEKKRNIYSYEDDEPFKIALVKNKVVKIEKLELQRE